MSKSVRTPLILVVLVSLVFASYWQIFAVQKARATEPPPHDPTFTPRFTDDAQGQVAVTASAGVNGANIDFYFNKNSTLQNLTADGFEASRGGGHSNVGDLHAPLTLYTLTASPGYTAATCGVITGSFNAVTSQSFFLVVSSPTPTSPKFAEGIATFNDRSQKYILFNSSANMAEICNNWGMDTGLDIISSLIALANGTYFHYRITPKSTIGDLTTYCRQMNEDWESLKTTMRGILVPSPVAGNSNWTTTAQATSHSVPWGEIGPFYAAQIFAHGTSTAEQAYWNSGLDTTIKYTLTDAGLQSYNTAWQTAQRISTDIAALRAQYGDTAWPTGCATLKKYKIALNLETADQTYSTLGEFAGIFDKIMNNFKLFTDILASPSSSASSTTDICGGLNFNITAGWTGIFQSMGCGIAEALHTASAYLMKIAFEILTAFIGVPIKFDDVAKDETATTVTGGATATATPGVSATPDSTTPVTPAPLNLKVNLTINNQANYTVLKSASHTGVWAKVKKNSGSDPIDARVNFGTWNDSSKSVDCTFATETNIPADWTEIKVYGGKSGSTNNLFVFSTNYPVSGTGQATSN